jgi:hypothetical protein
MTAREPTWQLSENHNESGPMIIRELLDAMSLKQPCGRDYVIYLTFGCNTPPNGDGCYTPADTATFAEIDKTDIPQRETATDALLVGAVSAPRVRDFVFYSSDPQRFLDTAAPLRLRYPQFRIGCECSPDPDWAQYRDLSHSISEDGG